MSGIWEQLDQAVEILDGVTVIHVTLGADADGE